MKKCLLALAAIVFVLSSCSFQNIKGDDNVISKSYTENGFKDIDVSSALEVHMTQGTAYSLKIEGEKNIVDLLNVKTKGDKLEIDIQDKISFSPTRPIKVFITSPAYRDISGSGACSFYTVQKLISTGDIKVDLSGSCTAKLELDAKKIVVDASGATDIELLGTATELDIDASGSTAIRAFGLITQITTLDMSGAGDAEVFASKSLSVDLSGAATVKYKGNPSSLKQEISEAGNVSKVD